METKSAKRSLITAMLVFGTIGIFRKYIPITSSWLSMLRGFIGMAFLLTWITVKKTPICWTTVKKNLLSLVLSGILIGLNWIALFESYNYTSVAVATLCYYMAPVIVILASPLLLGETLTPRKALCAAISFLGMVFVSGVMDGTALEPGALKGIALGLLAAFLYACVILMNKKMGPVAAYDKTIVQLGAAAIVLLPYNLFVPASTGDPMTPMVILLVAVVGIVHTGISYALYFGSMKYLPAQTVALYSYIDPVTAILLSLLIFQEAIGFWGILGAILILGATLASDLLDT